MKNKKCLWHTTTYLCFLFFGLYQNCDYGRDDYLNDHYQLTTIRKQFKTIILLLLHDSFCWHYIFYWIYIFF